MRNGHPIVDADGHVVEPLDLWDRYIDKEFYDRRPIVEDRFITVEGLKMSKLGLADPGSGYDIEEFNKGAGYDWQVNFGEQALKGFTSKTYVEMMDGEGIDQMVLYPSKGLYAASIEHMDGRLSAAICRAYNRWLHDFCAEAPDRLIGVAVTALHDPELAAAEARYAVEELGMRGCSIRPNPYAGRNLEDKAYDVYYAELTRLDVPLTIHEGAGAYMPQYGDRHESHLARHAMCHTMEQMGATFSLTVGGVMERHPTLRVAQLEAGGGWLPYWLDRLDEHAHWLRHAKNETGHLTMRPSDYFRRQGWIHVEPDDPTFRVIVDYLGADRTLWATDYPHPDGRFPGVVDGLDDAKGITPEEIERYACRNAQELYRL